MIEINEITEASDEILSEINRLLLSYQNPHLL